MARKPASPPPENNAHEEKDVSTFETIASDVADFESPAIFEKELSDEKDKYLRLAAEYDNFRKRSRKEREALFEDICADTVGKFLPVYDNLERALAIKTQDEAFYKGVEMIMAQFKEIFAKLGVVEIPALGECFDPDLHDAVMRIPDDSVPENTIKEVFQQGFKLGDKVIRFATVVVTNQ